MSHNGRDNRGEEKAKMSEAKEAAGIACGSSPLLSSDIAVGHCVIVNHVEKPCGKLVAVIVAIEGDKIRSKYLNADPILTQYNNRGVVSRRETVTPCGSFGVDVIIDDSGTYWCQPVGPSHAKYEDGDTRPWQDYSCVYQYLSRPDVLAVAKSACK